jgi:ribosomal protein L24
LYTAKLVHCDADWKKSGLRDTDFSLAFNEFTLSDYAYSVNTRMPYIRYSFTLPRVSKSGNYLLKVYKNRDESALIFTKRFMVVENLAAVAAQVVPPAQTEDRRTLQQINTSVNYSNLEVIDPQAQIKVVIRQNQRWDNAKVLSKPTFLNQNSKLLRYEPFEGESTFRAGNEFRFIDLRFIRATGVNVASVKVE